MQSITAGGGSPTRTLYVGNLYEETLTGTASPPYTCYYYLGSKMVGLRRASQTNTSTNGQYRMIGDHLGSTTLLVDTASPPNVVQRQYYKPYGEVAWSSGGGLTSYGYTGQRLDGDSGLMYYGARFYDPVLSYFVSADPSLPVASSSMDFDRYLYASGNPLRFIDTSGYRPEDQYVLVSGCVFNPGDCGKPGGIANEFLDELADLYTNVWGLDETKFGLWEQQHVHEVNIGPLDVAIGNLGGDKVRDALANLPKGGQIHLLGHSQGGAAIMAYLVDAANGSGPGYNQAVNSRIASVVTIDSPLKQVVDARLMKPGELSSYLCGHTSLCSGGAQSINIRNVDTADDLIGHSGVFPGLPASTYLTVDSSDYPVKTDQYGNNIPLPRNGNPVENAGRGADWHGWTSKHMANQTKQFLDRAWR